MDDFDEYEEYEPSQNHPKSSEDQYYILKNLKPVLSDFPSYVTFCEDDNQVMEETEIIDEIRVITTFTGTDQADPPDPTVPPLLFETVVYGTKLNIEDAYTTTLGDAKDFHYGRVFELRKLYKRDNESDA